MPIRKIFEKKPTRKSMEEAGQVERRFECKECGITVLRSGRLHHVQTSHNPRVKKKYWQWFK